MVAFLHCSFSVGSVYPVNAIIGGVISQEVIKVRFFVFCYLPYSYSIVLKYFSLLFTKSKSYTWHEYLNLGRISYSTKINGLSKKLFYLK